MSKYFIIRGGGCNVALHLGINLSNSCHRVKMAIRLVNNDFTFYFMGKKRCAKKIRSIHLVVIFFFKVLREKAILIVNFSIQIPKITINL